MKILLLLMAWPLYAVLDFNKNRAFALALLGIVIILIVSAYANHQNDHRASFALAAGAIMAYLATSIFFMFHHDKEKEILTGTGDDKPRFTLP